MRKLEDGKREMADVLWGDKGKVARGKRRGFDITFPTPLRSRN